MHCKHFLVKQCADIMMCAQELDPTGKFASESNVWDWTASKQGQNVTFSSCCGPDGFDSDCTCAPRQTC